MSHSARRLVTALLFAAFTTAPAAQAAEYAWGAIALDTSDLGPDGGYGLGGGDTEAEAKENALKFCAEDGAKGCQVVTSYEHCGSVAVKKSGAGGSWGVGDTKDGAAARALAKCGGEDVCKIVVTDCN